MSNDILYWSQVDIDRHEYFDIQFAQIAKRLESLDTSITKTDKALDKIKVQLDDISMTCQANNCAIHSLKKEFYQSDYDSTLLGISFAIGALCMFLFCKVL